MKIKWLIVFLPVFVFAGATGCRTAPGKLVPFTGMHMEKYSEQLEDVQFFISRQVVLHRSTESEKKEVTGKIHTLQVEKNLNIQAITFPAKTPGVLFGIDDVTLNVQFEPAREGRSRTIPFRKRNLVAGSEKPENAVFVFDSEMIAYDGEAYQVYYEEENVAVTEEDNTVYAEKANAEQGQFITKKRFPILLINPVKNIGRLTEDNRTVSGVWEDTSPQ